jgi:hypothetical protein
MTLQCRKTIELVLLPLLVAATIIGCLAFSRAPTYISRDELAYASIAHELNNSGIFHDGKYAMYSAEKKSSNAGEIVPGRFFAPAYPAFLALMGRLDDEVAASLACATQGRKIAGTPPPDCKVVDLIRSDGDRETCASGRIAIPASVIATQSALLSIAALMVFLAAYYVSGKIKIVAWTTMIVMAVWLHDFPYLYFTENLAFMAFFGFLGFLVIAWSKRSVTAILAAGIMLGLAIMTRPSYLYLFYFAVPAVFLLYHFTQRSGLRNAFAFTAPVLLIIVPWAVRNYIHFGDFSLTSGYDAFILIGRVIYNQMSWPEWWVAFIYYLPGIGEQLAALLFEPEFYQKLYNGKNENYAFEVEAYKFMAECYTREQTIAAAGGLDKHFSYLLHEYLLNDLFKHIMVSIPITLRGIYVGGSMSILGLFLLVPVAVILHQKQMLTGFMLFITPSLFMAALHGFAAPNYWRYNLPMLAIYVFVITYYAHHLYVNRIAPQGKDRNAPGDNF